MCPERMTVATAAQGLQVSIATKSTLTITVGESLDKGLRDLANTTQAVSDGREISPQFALGFKNMAQMGEVCSPMRWELVEMLKQTGPQSIYALATVEDFRRAVGLIAFCLASTQKSVVCYGWTSEILRNRGILTEKKPVPNYRKITGNRCKPIYIKVFESSSGHHGTKQQISLFALKTP